MLAAEVGGGAAEEAGATEAGESNGNSNAPAAKDAFGDSAALGDACKGRLGEGASERAGQSGEAMACAGADSSISTGGS
jgi:hypothetical protein